MIKRKRYSQEFKEQIVLELLSGQSNISQIAKREGIANYTISKWRDNFNNGKFKDQNRIEIELRRRITSLESTVAELALENNILKKAKHHMQEMARKERLSKTFSPMTSEQSKAVKQ